MKRAWNFDDKTGKKFGRLTVLEISRTEGKKVFWKCLCECGKIVEQWGPSLSTGHVKSCGCLRDDTIRELRTTHGQSSGNGSAEYRAWCLMKARCLNPSVDMYPHY